MKNNNYGFGGALVTCSAEIQIGDESGNTNNINICIPTGDCVCYIEIDSSKYGKIQIAQISVEELKEISNTIINLIKSVTSLEK